MQIFYGMAILIQYPYIALLIAAVLARLWYLGIFNAFQNSMPRRL